MPFITIHARAEDPALDLTEAAGEIAAETGIALERLNLMVDTRSGDRFYRGSGRIFPVIHIAVRSHNGRELIHSLMRACGRAVAKQLGAGEADIDVFVHPIEDGYLLSGGKII